MEEHQRMREMNQEESLFYAFGCLDVQDGHSLLEEFKQEESLIMDNESEKENSLLR
eukprot:CAMPEP_0202979028 /NCGR_PEP_ID=MMETSP1396-20130829/85297_1 /ASSEMBLY_ACC=CAM_ASM_000872 /TAXON_ID= /ORGANISM="Pseudokeronopsis sp., Strain Brazil" /LENGTH=55 /DNA_ID=CAMNT_0049718281 /DNA_START=975 /DNA_END=1142 /DNA_ORIENTATION=-